MMRLYIFVLFLSTYSFLFAQYNEEFDPKSFAKSLNGKEFVVFDGKNHRAFQCIAIDTFIYAENNWNFLGGFRDIIDNKIAGGNYRLSSLLPMLEFKEQKKLFIIDHDNDEESTSYFHSCKIIKNNIVIFGYKLKISNNHVSIWILIKNDSKKTLNGFEGIVHMYDNFGNPVIWGGGSNTFKFFNQSDVLAVGESFLFGPWDLALYDNTRKVKLNFTKLYFEK